MQSALNQFRANIERVRSIHQLYLSLSLSVMPVLDVSDLLRAEIVLIVSALDHFIHELARQGMIEVWKGARSATPSFEKFPVTLNTTRLIAAGIGGEGALDAEIRSAHSWRSFQRPDSIADAIRLFCTVDLWRVVAVDLGTSPADLKSRIGLLVDRRNKIAHEADIDPSFPNQRWTIDRTVAEDGTAFVERLGESIFKSTA